MVLSSLTSALLIITLAVYFAMLFFAQRQLAKKPYFAYRVGNILLHVQLQVWYAARLGGSAVCCVSACFACMFQAGARAFGAFPPSTVQYG